MLLSEIRDWLKTSISTEPNYAVGKINESLEKQVGIFQFATQPEFKMAIGGQSNKLTDELSVTLLIHWTKSHTATETYAKSLYNLLLGATNVSINGHMVHYIQMMYNEPIDISTDKNGIYEQTISFKMYYDTNISD